MNIRRIQPKDNVLLKTIIIDVLKSFGAKGPGYASQDEELNYLSDFFNKPKSAYWIIVDRQDTVLGGAGVGPLKGSQGGWCELQKMYFKPELRGLGFGKKLIERCLAFAVQQGFENCYLETLPNMTAAQKLYRLNGFEYINTRMGATGHTSCNVFMAKKLHQSELR